MRRALVLTVALAAVTLAMAPAALAQGPLVRLPPSSSSDDGDDPAPAPRRADRESPAPRSSKDSSLSIGIGGVALVLMGLGGAMTFALSVVAARRARRPKVRPPPKRSFEHGRSLAGYAATVLGEADAVRALERLPVGTLQGVTPIERGYRIVVARKRSEPCDVVAGYITGIFEAGWAHDVVLRHDACAGKAKGAVCVYDVRDPVRSPVNRSDAPAGVAGTPRSGDAPHRWPPARPGGA